MNKALVCLSGGMDSTTSLYKITKEYDKVMAVSFFYGQKHKKEIEFAKWHCDKLNIHHKVIDITFLGEITNSTLVDETKEIPQGMYDADNMKSTVVPFRNGIMLAILASYAESNDCSLIVYGAHKGDHAIYADCTNEFNNSMAQAIKTGTSTRVDIIAPFIDQDKTDICGIGLNLGVNFSKTWTCYVGKDEPCGMCGSCVERTEAFILNNTLDPLYTIEGWNNAVKYYNKVSNEN